MPLSPGRTLVGDAARGDLGDMAAAWASLATPPELSRAAGAHLPRFRGTSRAHTESDLRVFFVWCQDRQLAPLAAKRNDLYLRWLQDVRRLKPSTVSRRLSVVAGFSRTCVIDGPTADNMETAGHPANPTRRYPDRTKITSQT